MSMAHPRNCEPRRAIVTGGSSGIGQATCVALAAMGCDVGFTWRSNEAGARQTLARIEAHGRRGEMARLDLAAPASAGPVVDQLADALGGVDACVANAGVSLRHDLLAMTLEEWRANLIPDLDGSFVTLQAAARRMVAAGTPGSLVAVTSVHEHVPQPGGASYTAAKHGLGGLVKAMALDLARHGIRVNAVAPGETATKINPIDPDEVMETARPSIPAGRPAFADEVAEVIAFLCSARASYVTGASWAVDGGFASMTAMASEQYRGE